MLDPEIARINEIEFLSLCTKILAYRNNPKDIATLLKSMTYLIDFNFSVIWDLSKEIFDMKYKVHKIEIIKILKKQDLTNASIARYLGNSRAVIGNWVKNNDIVLYPRGSKEQELELNKFMEGYRKITQIDIIDLI